MLKRLLLSSVLLSLFPVLTALAGPVCVPAHSNETKIERKIREAQAAGLDYTFDQSTGILRDGAKEPGFTYSASDKSPIDDPAVLERIKKLGVPPGVENETVWISANPNSHIQATWIDSRNRTQYRYHPKWNALAAGVKFGKIVEFGRSLPEVRKDVETMLLETELNERRILGVLIRILDLRALRIGNKEYAEKNEHYGLTTLLKKDVTVEGDTIRFTFVGKEGKNQDHTIRDAQVAKAIGELKDLEGPLQFQFRDRTGALRAVDPDQVNRYLKARLVGDFSAKDFRTWIATVTAARALAQTGIIREAAVQAAEILGNEPSEAKKSYIHPKIFELFRKDPAAFRKALAGTDADFEKRVIELLESEG